MNPVLEKCVKQRRPTISLHFTFNVRVSSYLVAMTTTIMISLLLVVCCSVVCSAWRFKRDYKNCFCKAVNIHNSGDIIKDFGSIQQCRAFPACSCHRTEMMTCGTQCDRKVKEWVCHHECGENRAVRGVQIRVSFTASTCHSNTTDLVYECASQVNCAF